MSKFFESLSNIQNELPDYEILRRFNKSRILAERLKYNLNQKGLNQSEFAKLIDVNKSDISKWMSGHHNFTWATILRIEYALGADLLSINTPIHFQIDLKDHLEWKFVDCLSPSSFQSHEQIESDFDLSLSELSLYDNIAATEREATEQLASASPEAIAA